MQPAKVQPNPYESGTPGSTSSDTESDQQICKPRLGRWHIVTWLLMMICFSYWSVKWVIDWEADRGRTAATERLVWNGITVHSGPLAGVYYWDVGQNRPKMILRSVDLITRPQRRPHLYLCLFVFPSFLFLIWPSTGIGLKPVRALWRVLIGLAFVMGATLWYFSAMISIAMLS